MDGWVTVGTKLDTKQLDKDLKNAERRLKQYESEAEKLTKAKTKVEIDLQAYEEEKRLIQQITDEANRYAQTEEEVTNNLLVEQGQLEKLNNKYSKQLSNLSEINEKIQKNARNQALVTNEIEETNQKLNKAKGINSIQDVMENVNKSTSSAIKKVGRWALAVFGVRSAYLFVRQAISTLSQYNEQMATDLEYIKFAIASSLQPLIEGLISLAYKLLTYVNYIAQAWFGVDLFANASANAMRKASQSAEKMKKSLAGFDEMNILNDNGTTGAMGALPSVDLSEIDNVDLENTWIGWIARNKSKVISGLLGIATALIAIHLGLKPIQALGIGVALSGIIYSIMELLEYLKDPTFDNFGGIIQGIGVAIIGVGIAFAGLPGIIIGAIVLIYGTILKYWEDIKTMFQNGIDWLASKSDWIRDIFGDTAGDMYDSFVGNLQEILNWFDKTFEKIKNNFDEIISFIKNVFAGNWKAAWQNVKNIFKNIWEEIKLTAQTFASTIGESMFGVFKNIVNSILNAVETILNKPIKTINSLLDVINEVPGIDLGKLPTFKLPRLAVGGIVNMPGRGIMYGGANIGERGAEGVIPLTNSQMMSQLGEAIGRYVTINANITNTMNGRVISRELQKVNNNSDFAFNR